MDEYGLLNFRAVSPYPATDGRLKPDTLHRSGMFDGATQAGIEHLERIGVTTVFDLRSDREKQRRPSPLLDREGFRVVSHPHDLHSGDLSALLSKPASSAEACRKVMKGIYAKLPSRFSEVYRHYFRTAADDGFPLAIHCTAGKDRTGVAIAMVLELLGVSRDDIMEDYLKSDAARDALRDRFVRRNQGLDFGRVADHLVEPVISADPDYLNAMFIAVDADFGGVETYVSEVLALSPDDVAQLRNHLLE